MRKTIAIVSGSLLIMRAQVALAMRADLNLQVKDYMTVTQFQGAGPSKLTPSEMVALDNWFSMVADKLVKFGITKRK